MAPLQPQTSPVSKPSRKERASESAGPPGLRQAVADLVVGPGARSPRTVAPREEILEILVTVNAIVGGIQGVGDREDIAHRIG